MLRREISVTLFDMSSTSTSNHGSFAHEIRQILDFLTHFVRRPVEMIKHTPDLSWRALFTVQIGAALTSGVLLGAFTHSVFDFFLGLIVLPITTLLSTLILSSFLFYFFSLFRSTYLDFRRLYTVVVFSNLTYFLFHITAGFIPPMDLLGFALTCILMVVGISEQFSQDRKLILKLIGSIYALFVVLWIVGQIRLNGPRPDASPNYHPRTMDELEHDVK